MERCQEHFLTVGREAARSAHGRYLPGQCYTSQSFLTAEYTQRKMLTKGYDTTEDYLFDLTA